MRNICIISTTINFKKLWQAKASPYDTLCDQVGLQCMFLKSQVYFMPKYSETAVSIIKHITMNHKLCALWKSEVMCIDGVIMAHQDNGELTNSIKVLTVLLPWVGKHRNIVILWQRKKCIVMYIHCDVNEVKCLISVIAIIN